MEEIAQQFREELQELLDRYKNRLSVPHIMSVAQDVFHKTLSIRYHPELHSKAISYFLQSIRYNKPDPECRNKIKEYNLQDCKATCMLFKAQEQEHERFIDINGLKVPAELIDGPDPEFRKILQGDPNA